MPYLEIQDTKNKFTEEIFDSFFKLNYKKVEYEEEYQKSKMDVCKQYSKIMTLFVFIASCITSLEISFFFNEYEKTSFKAVMIISYFVSFTYLIMLIICLSTTKIIVHKSINYLNYFLFLFVFVNFRYPLVQYVQINGFIFCIIVCVELMVRFIWNILNILGFLESLILNALHIVFEFVLYGIIGIGNPMGITNIMLVAVAYATALLIVILFSYFLERQQRRTYYYYLKESKKASWLLNVLENMNTGFLSIKGEDITYINEYLSQKLEQSKQFQDKSECEFINPVNHDVPNRETNLLIKNNKEDKSACTKHNANALLYSLLSNLHTDTITEQYVADLLNDFKRELMSPSVESSQNVPSDYVIKFKECISKISSISNFVYIGEQTLNPNNENNQIDLEVYCRFNKLPYEQSELNLLFNDVTRSKINENLKAEFKYKSLFLSKIAHEFKNPLICISELIKQIYSSPEVQENLLSANFDKNLSQIKSMSNFLLILVKDLDYFSQSQTEDKITLENKETNLDELIEFCNEISHSLLNKSNKSEEVKFKVHKEIDVPKFIMIDEWRLKQILINLISNAVKFTYYGEILLEISLEILTKPLIKFLVKDTGIGIKPELQAQLFQPFKKGTILNNEMGAGLGLSIVRELTKKLGGSIEFSSEFEKGSSFWFYLPLEDEVFLKRQEEQESAIIGGKGSSLNIVIDNNDNNESSTHTKEVDFVFDKSEIDNIEWENEEECHSNSDNQNLNNLIKLKNTFPDLHFVRMKSDSYLSKNIRNKNSLFTQSESRHSLFHENVKRELQRQDIDKETFTVLDLILKNVAHLRTEQHNKKLINVIIADDEKITRQSTIRMVKEVTKDLPIQLNIIESDDGIETIYLLYKSVIQGIKISMIFSDETMNYLNGSKCSQIIQELTHKHMSTIPFFLVTAYESFTSLKSITKVLSKPLSKAIAHELFKEYIL